MPYRIVVDDQFHGIQDSHHAGCGFIEIFPDAEFQECHIDDIFALGDSNQFGKGPDGCRGVSAPAQTMKGWHPGIIPPADVTLCNQLEQFPLAHDGIAEIQAGKFDLSAGEYFKFLDEPFVQRPVGNKLKRAQGMSDPFD